MFIFLSAWPAHATDQADTPVIQTLPYQVFLSAEGTKKPTVSTDGIGPWRGPLTPCFASVKTIFRSCPYRGSYIGMYRLSQFYAGICSVIDPYWVSVKLWHYYSTLAIRPAEFQQKSSFVW